MSIVRDSFDGVIHKLDPQGYIDKAYEPITFEKVSTTGGYFAVVEFIVAQVSHRFSNGCAYLYLSTDEELQGGLIFHVVENPGSAKNALSVIPGYPPSAPVNVTSWPPRNG